MMATRRVEIGPTGETVRANVKLVRKQRRLTLRDVSDRLTAAGWPMAHNTVSEIERGARRVDVDDLVALAAVLDVLPGDLLMPIGEDATADGNVVVSPIPAVLELQERVSRLEVAAGLPAAGVVKDAAGNVISDESGNPPVSEAQEG